MAVGPDKASFLIDQIASRCGEWRDLFAAIGLTVITGVSVKLVWKLGRTLWVHYGGTMKQQEARLLMCGQWAIINGCNDEIGKEFAFQLANIGLDLILIAPDNKQLTNQFIDEIITKYKVQCVKIYMAPGSNEGLAFYDDVVECVKDKNVGILINNVHSFLSRSNVISKNDDDVLIRNLNANLFSVTMLTNKVLQSCLLPRKHGAIIFINGAVQYPSLFSPAKFAAKNYIDKCAERLYHQLHSHNIHVQLLTPCSLWNPATVRGDGYFSGPTLFNPLTSVYVGKALGTIFRTHCTTGYFPHTVQLWFTPNERCFFFMNRILSYLRNHGKQ